MAFSVYLINIFNTFQITNSDYIFYHKFEKIIIKNNLFKYSFILLIAFIPNSLFSQNNFIIDSIVELRELAKDFNLPIEDRFKYVKAAIKLSKDTKNDSTILLSDRVLSLVYLDKEDYPNFRIINFKNLKAGKKLNDSISIAYALHNLAWYHHEYSLKMDSAYYYYFNARKVYSRLDDVMNESQVLMNMANIQDIEKDFIGAEENAIQGIKLLENISKNEDVYENLWSLNNIIALISERLNNHERAVEYFDKTIEISKKMENSRYYYLNSINNLGYTVERQGNLEKALELYQEVANDKGLFEVDPELHIVGLGNVARIKFKLDINEAENSKKTLFNLLKITDSIDDTINEMGLYGFLANIYTKTNKKDSALYFSNKSYKLAKITNSNTEKLDALKLMANLEGGEKGIQHLKSYIKLNDSLLLKERSIRNKFARIKFETDEIKAENEQISRENLILLVLSSALLLTLLLLYVIISQRAKNKELKYVKQQQESNEEIYNLMLEQQNKIEEGRTHEKKRISEELHDGILSRLFGTRLSLDSLNMVKTDEAIKTRENYIVELKAIENEIRKISHDLNTDFIADSGFIDIIETLIEKQTKAYQLTYDFDYDDSIDFDVISNKNKIHLYRIIQESLQNIYKHAKASDVKIGFQLKNSVILVSIKDDGSGFDIDKAKKGIGLKNINSRVSELEGKVAINSKIGEGTSVLISLPV
jgi:signal transduction histidine kinase